MESLQSAFPSFGIEDIKDIFGLCSTNTPCFIKILPQKLLDVIVESRPPSHEGLETITGEMHTRSLAVATS